jgi:hypothetical protein
MRVGLHVVHAPVELLPRERGFTSDDLACVEAYRSDGEESWVAGFVIRLLDGRRFYTGVTCSVDARGAKRMKLDMVPLPKTKDHLRVWEMPLQSNEIIEFMRGQPAAPRDSYRLVRLTSYGKAIDVMERLHLILRW